MFSTAVLIALWAVVLWRAPVLRQDRWKRAPAVALAMLAIALTVNRPSLISRIDHATGIADFATLIKHVAGVVASTAVLDWVSALARPGRATWLRSHRAAAAAAIACMTVLFAAMRRPESANFTATVTGGFGAAYLLVFYGYLGAAMTAAAILFWHASREPAHPTARWGMWLLATGTTCGAAYAIYQIIYLGLRVPGVLGPAAAGIALSAGTDIENAAIVLILAGVSLPAAGVAWQALCDLMALRALRGLWHGATAVAPQVAAGPWDHTLDRVIRYPHVRLIRRAAEIRDAALALRGYVPPEKVDAARSRLADRGLAGQRLDAATEACWFALASQAARSGLPRASRTHVLPGGATLPEEVRWLRLVAAAARSDRTRAVAAELADTTTRAQGRSLTVATDTQPAARPFAKHITDALEPKNWIILTAILIGWHSGGFAGIGWGLAGALFAAILPTLFIRRGMRPGRGVDRHVGDRGHRLVVMAFIVASVGTGAELLAGLGAPRPVLAMTVTMLAAITVLMTITVTWKISVHCAVSSGATVMLALTYGPWWLTLYALVGLVAWSRAALRDHTPAQAAAGAALGALSALIFLALR